MEIGDGDGDRVDVALLARPSRLDCLVFMIYLLLSIELGIVYLGSPIGLLSKGFTGLA